MEESSSTRKRKLDSPNTKHKVTLRSHCKMGQTKLSECISCPVCTLSIRGEKELKLHYNKEVKKFDSLGKNLMGKKFSMRLRSSQDDEDEKFEEMKLCERENILQNIKKNKYDRYSQMFLFSINRTKVLKNSSYNNDTNSSWQTQRSGYDLAQCAICNEFLEISNEESSRHLSKCFAKKDHEFSLYSESENEDDDIVEEFSWAGQTWIRTSSLVNREAFQSEGRLTRVEMEDTDEILDVDGDDEYYGDEQFSEANIIPCVNEDSNKTSNQVLRNAVVGGNLKRANSLSSSHWTETGDIEPVKSLDRVYKDLNYNKNEFIKFLKERIKASEERLDNEVAKCSICMSTYKQPLVATSCWHVCCAECWMRSLGAKKLCPKCNNIVTPSQLRKIYI